jgi:prepilin-type N-terminal cleavage/methylation domain-containing protein
VPRSRGYTIIEVVLVLSLIAIMAAMALPKVSFVRYRQDANGRLVQKTLISAQQTAVRKNVNVLVVIDYASSRLLVLPDANDNGLADDANGVSWKLAEGAKFAIPTSTVDAATPYYATGTTAITTTAAGPMITFYPNGSASGDAYIYVGVPNGRADALRAVELAGSTGRTRLYRYVGARWVLSTP